MSKKAEIDPDMQAINNGTVIDNIKYKLAKLAGMDVFSQEDLDDRLSDINSTFGPGAGDAIVPYHDETEYNELLARKIGEKFAGIKGVDDLEAGVRSALTTCEIAGRENPDAQDVSKWLSEEGHQRLTDIQVAVQNLEQVAPVWEAATALEKELNKMSSRKKKSTEVAEAQDDLEKGKTIVQDAVTEVVGCLSNAKKRIQDIDIDIDMDKEGRPSIDKIASNLKQRLFEVKYPIMASISKEVRRFFPKRPPAGRKPPPLKPNNNKIER